jgi:hypothetical protein
MYLDNIGYYIQVIPKGEKSMFNQGSKEDSNG